MDVSGIDQFLEQWEMNARDIQWRVILTPTPWEWKTLACRLAAGLGLDSIGHDGGTGTVSPHPGRLRHPLEGGCWGLRWRTGPSPKARSRCSETPISPCSIGRWAFGEGGPEALIFAQTGGPPIFGEAEQAALKGAVVESLGVAGLGMANWTPRLAQEEGGASVFLGTVWHQPEPQQLFELPAPVGVCFKASREAAGQGGCGHTGGIRSGVHRPAAGSQADWRQGILCRRGHFLADAKLRAKGGVEGRAGIGGLHQPAVWREGQLLYSAVCGIPTPSDVGPSARARLRP